MKRVEAGHYCLQVDDKKYIVLREEEKVPNPKEEDKIKILVTWTPYLEGNEEAFGGQSYVTYKEAKEAVHNHIISNLPSLV